MTAAIGWKTRRTWSTCEVSAILCAIWGKNKAIALGKKIGKTFALDRKIEEERFVEYAGNDNHWELWHALMGHTSENGMVKTLQVTHDMPALRRGIKTICSGCMKVKHVSSTINIQDSACFEVSSYGCDETHANGIERRSQICANICERFYTFRGCLLPKE